MNNPLILIVTVPLAVYMSYTLYIDTKAMIKAPKGEKIDAYYASIKSRRNKQV